MTDREATNTNVTDREATGAGPTDLDASTEPVDRTGPLRELAATVDDERASDGDSSPGSSTLEFDDLFDREDVADVDGERLWERLEGDDPADEVAGTEREIRTVEKGSYCHQCEHFSVPPTVACTREGTDILEMPSLETFRVADCPVVREDERLERRS